MKKSARPTAGVVTIGARTPSVHTKGLNTRVCMSSARSTWAGSIFSARPDCWSWFRENSRTSTLGIQTAASPIPSAVQPTRGSQKRGRARMEAKASRGEKYTAASWEPAPSWGDAGADATEGADYARGRAGVKPAGASLVPQRLDGVEAGRLGRRPQAEEQAHRE